MLEYHLFKTIKETLLGRSKLVYRLLRLGVRTAIALDENNLLLVVGYTIYEFNLFTGRRTSGYRCGDGVRPLIFTDIKGIEGIEDGVYFGTYKDVLSKSPIHIYKRGGQDKWNIVYTFEQGSMEHIHNIISDTYRKCLWIFSGDFGDSAAIWKATENFRKVERVFYGNQKFRACVANALPEGLLYATDSPLDDDYIFLLIPETGELKEIMPIAGSCIYGCKWKDQYVFESSVEPNGIYNNKLDFLFRHEKGPGIKDEYVRIYCGNLKNGFIEIYQEKKDWLPYASFHFGVVRFPTGKNTGDKLWFQPIAVKRKDLMLMSIDFATVWKYYRG